MYLFAPRQAEETAGFFEHKLELDAACLAVAGTMKFCKISTLLLLTTSQKRAAGTWVALKKSRTELSCWFVVTKQMAVK